MIFRLFPSNRQEATIKALYGAIVAQARLPVFYRDYGVPDTVNGRFDMIVLHLALLLDRMEAGSEPMRTQGQAVFDLFCREMDGHFREVGISDLKVPKEMREMGQAFYGRRSVYREALAAPDNRALAEAITRNIYTEETGAKTDAKTDAKAGAKAGAERLAAYVRTAAQSLSQNDHENGRLTWPDPQAVQAG
jgi:cytochrome b pre-mRNA-processing protein 3